MRLDHRDELGPRARAAREPDPAVELRGAQRDVAYVGDVDGGAISPALREVDVGPVAMLLYLLQLPLRRRLMRSWLGVPDPFNSGAASFLRRELVLSFDVFAMVVTVRRTRSVADDVSIASDCPSTRVSEARLTVFVFYPLLAC